MSATVEIANDIALIRMDDNKANAINFDMLAALNAALDTAEAEAKAIVLTGREGRFSGGFDLNAFASLGSDVYKLLDAGAELLLRLYGGPLPLVAACTGHAIAMGVFILHACDTRIGTAGDYKIGANEAITGMNLPIFAMELARDRLHPSHLTRAMVQGFIYNPEGVEHRIQPLQGTLAIFLSELEHEVLLTSRDRMSITGWMLNETIL